MPEKEDQREFWREFETRRGEKVLAHSLGRFVSGWPEFKAPLWGLLIATSGGFVFHHFPHVSWIDALMPGAGKGEATAEKTAFIPRGRIAAAEFRREKSVLRRILFPGPPLLVIRYRTEAGAEERFVAEADAGAEAVARSLMPACLAGCVPGRWP